MNLNKMTKEELELLSYTDIAKMYLEENKVQLSTADLFHKVCELLDMTESDYEDKIADFFQSLTTSKEFILLPDGKWDLKSKHSVKIVMEDLYEEKDDDDEDYEVDTDSDEQDEYNSIDDEEDYSDEDLSDLTIMNEEDMENE